MFESVQDTRLEDNVKKKLLLTGCILTLIFTMAGCGKKAYSVTYIMSDVQEGDHPTAIACDDFAKMVYKKTNGRINIEVYHGDALGSEAEQLKQVSVGGIDFARVSGPLSNYEENMKAFQALYLFEKEDDLWDSLNGPLGDELLNSSAFTENNIQGLCWFSGGSRNFYNSKKEITKPEDMKGLKLRVNTDSMIKQVERNGGEPLNIAYNDIYDSIKSDIIDGAENNWPSYISTEHYEVAKYITLDRHTCLPEMIVASKSALDAMSEKDRQIVMDCAKEISKKQIQAFREYDEEAIEKAKKAGCVITELTAEQSAAFREQGKKINEEVSSQYADMIQRLTGGK